MARPGDQNLPCPGVSHWSRPLTAFEKSKRDHRARFRVWAGLLPVVAHGRCGTFKDASEARTSVRNNVYITVKRLNNVTEVSTLLPKQNTVSKSPDPPSMISKLACPSQRRIISFPDHGKARTEPEEMCDFRVHGVLDRRARFGRTRPWYGTFKNWVCGR